MGERQLRLEGKVAIVTGAGSRGPGIGNGKATSILFAREGAKVLLVDLFEDRALETHRIIQEEGGESAVFEADLSKENSARQMVEYAVKTFGRLDILHNNVGIGIPGSILEMTEADWDRILAVNVKSLAFSSKYAILEMKESGGGSIINISSIAAMRCLRVAAYALTKGGIIALTRTMAVQHAKDNIRVNCIAPGTVYTPMVAEGLTDEGRALRRDSVPLGTEGTAWDIGWAAVYLASDEARWVTGVVLPVDGGLTLTTEPTVTRSDFEEEH